MVSINSQLTDGLKCVLAPVVDVDQGVLQRGAAADGDSYWPAHNLGSALTITVAIRCRADVDHQTPNGHSGSNSDEPTKRGKAPTGEWAIPACVRDAIDYREC